MNFIIKYFFGYLRIKLTGDDVCRFLNICNSRGIDMWNLNNTEEIYTMCISIDDFFGLKDIAAKTGTRVRIIDKCGYPFFVKRNRHRKAFAAGIIVFFAIVYSMSLFVWDIKFEGLYTYTEDAFMEYLRENNIDYGTIKADIDCARLEKMIRNDFLDITWVSVSLSGTRLSINIKENYDYDVAVNSSYDYDMSDIIATKNGIITSIITRHGTPLIREGMVAGTGDILVSGNIVVTDEYGAVVKESYVNADADIKAKVVYDYSDTIAVSQVVREYTGMAQKAYGVRLFGKKIYLSGKKVKYDLFDKTVEEHQVRISDNFYLPIFWWETSYNEYEEICIELSEEDIVNRLNNNLKNFFDELLQKGVQIIENNVTIVKDGGAYTAEGKIIVIEDFGKNVPVWELYRPDEDNTERNE